MITRETIAARIAELRAELETVMANANAINGAIQDCEYWLAQLARQETPTDGGEETA